MFGSVVAVAFQNAFHLSMHQNNNFLFFKKYFWYQDIKMIKKQTGLNRMVGRDSSPVPNKLIVNHRLFQQAGALIKDAKIRMLIIWCPRRIGNLGRFYFRPLGAYRLHAKCLPGSSILSLSGCQFYHYSTWIQQTSPRTISGLGIAEGYYFASGGSRN